MLFLGYLVCLDAFLFLFTFLPIRAVFAVVSIIRWVIARLLFFPDVQIDKVSIVPIVVGSEVHSPSVGSEVHSPSVGSEVHSPSVGSEVHSPSVGSEVHSPSVGSEVHSPSVGSEVHSP